MANPPPDPSKLSVLGLGDYASYLFGESEGIKQARDKLNRDYLGPLSFANDLLKARIAVSGSLDDVVRLRQLLEKLEVALDEESAHTRGLGSNNLLFMACELLLLAAETDGFPLLLIEEPEAHLHPQRQLRLMSFLQEQADKVRPDGQKIQVLVTTHSPTLASDIRLNNLALLEGGKGFPLAEGCTKLTPSDYLFLGRFLDATKANLFFARAVLIVEGDAENILLPVIARLVNRDLQKYGVSVVNVGGVGLGRYARIFMREDEASDGTIEIPVACITDLDVMPNMAPEIIGKIKPGEDIPPLAGSKRQWRTKSDLGPEGIEARRKNRKEKASGQGVETFVANEWTLEYDLAFHGLSRLVWGAAHLALAEDALLSGKKKKADVLAAAAAEFQKLVDQGFDTETLSTHVYALFERDGTSKAVAAQYLAAELEASVESESVTPASLRAMLPPYVVSAIVHVTEPFAPTPGETHAPGGGNVA
jgi:putative ATP-dependent endonuclease of the OLD family